MSALQGGEPISVHVHLRIGVFKDRGIGLEHIDSGEPTRRSASKQAAD